MTFVLLLWIKLLESEDIMYWLIWLRSSQRWWWHCRILIYLLDNHPVPKEKWLFFDTLCHHVVAEFAIPFFQFLIWIVNICSNLVEMTFCFLHSCPPLLLSSARESLVDPKGPLPIEQPTEISLWERLGKASMLDIESSLFSWDMLSSLHHTEHSSSTDQSEDELNKALEVCGQFEPNCLEWHLS